MIDPSETLRWFEVLRHNSPFVALLGERNAFKDELAHYLTKAGALVALFRSTECVQAILLLRPTTAVWFRERDEDPCLEQLLIGTGTIPIVVVGATYAELRISDNSPRTIICVPTTLSAPQMARHIALLVCGLGTPKTV